MALRHSLRQHLQQLHDSYRLLPAGLCNNIPSCSTFCNNPESSSCSNSADAVVLNLACRGGSPPAAPMFQAARPRSPRLFSQSPAGSARCVHSQAAWRLPRSCLPQLSECFTSSRAVLRQQPPTLHPQPRSFAAGPAAVHQLARYRVTVVTGDVRGAGSPAPAVIQLIGSEGVSDQVAIADDPDCPGFSRGSRTEVEIEVPHGLGELLRVVVRQENASDSDVGVGWFLDYVEVVGPGSEYRSFPCSNWLGQSDADGKFVGEKERNLIPPHADVENVTEYLAEPLHVATAAVVVPHPDKITPQTKAVLQQGFGYGGEDAYYSSWGPRNGMLGLGVADGVYMWRSQGIDAGVFSRSLMLSAKNAIEYGQTDVFNVMTDAALTVEENGIKGSATCCLVVVDTLQGRLNSANIGDSGYVIIGTSPRNDKPHVKFRSPQQEHTFGYPYQLGHQVNADKADDAMLAHIPLVPDDVLVMGSDGLFDNVSDDEILHLVQKAKADSSSPRPMHVAQQLTKAAFYNSLDKNKVTPYSLGATEAFDLVFNGGKQDDITIVVALFSGEMVKGRVGGDGRHGL